MFNLFGGLRGDHKKILEACGFERWGPIGEVLKSPEYDGCRVVYAVTNAENTEVVYVGDTEQGRDVRARLTELLKSASKEDIQQESEVYVHYMVTAYLVLSDFEEVTGKLPALNKKKSQRHA